MRWLNYFLYKHEFIHSYSHDSYYIVHRYILYITIHIESTPAEFTEIGDYSFDIIFHQGSDLSVLKTIEECGEE